MASNSSKALPYIVLTILALSLVGEAVFEINIDLETYIPLLMAIGLGGAGLSAVKKASEARKKMPKEIENLITAKFKELLK